ncbi:MAG: iron-sulfur cluster assembly scaffold protein [Pseudomonadota bacterium]
MASDTDLVKLYSGRILALAADIPRVGRLNAPSASSRQQSPQCGSTVTVDLVIDASGRIVDFAQDVRACALGQAAAAVLGRSVIGQTRAELDAARQALRRMLKEDGSPPQPPFSELEVLRPAREFVNRHPSILLAFDAACDALAQAEHAA